MRFFSFSSAFMLACLVFLAKKTNNVFAISVRQSRQDSNVDSVINDEVDLMNANDDGRKSMEFINLESFLETSADRDIEIGVGGGIHADIEHSDSGNSGDIGSDIDIGNGGHIDREIEVSGGGISGDINTGNGNGNVNGGIEISNPIGPIGGGISTSPPIGGGISAAPSSRNMKGKANFQDYVFYDELSPDDVVPPTAQMLKMLNVDEN